MMEEAFTPVREVAQKLGKPYTIKVGKYKSEKNRNFYKVKF